MRASARKSGPRTKRPGDAVNVNRAGGPRKLQAPVTNRQPRTNRPRPQPNKHRTPANSFVGDVLGDAATPYQAERILAEVALARLRARIEAAEVAVRYSPKAAREILGGVA